VISLTSRVLQGYQAICAATLAAVLVPALVVAQVGATLGGAVTDESGGALPGVTITVTNRATGAAQVLTTGLDGHYRAVQLTPSTYEISAELAGFASTKREITLNIGGNQLLDLKLVVASLQESVTVTGAHPMIEVAKSQLSSVMDSERIASLPVLSRNILELAQILPGSAPDNSRTQPFATTKFGGVADQRTGFTFMVDGGTLDDAIWGSTLVNVSQEAVQEFVVLRNNFDAQYGSALSSVVSVATKSGTNALRGNASYFGRDQALSARNAFDRGETEQPFDQQRVGLTIGGPIRHDRTHFFGAFEYNNTDTVKILALPPTNPFAAQYNGSFPAGVDDKMSIAKLDHRFGAAHSMSARYLFDDQYLLRENTTAESNQRSEANKTHSLVARENWIVSQSVVNTLNVHVFYQHLDLIAHSAETRIIRPSLTTGTSGQADIQMPRWQTVISDSLYLNMGRHDLKLGGELGLFRGRLDSKANIYGGFTFQTNAAFDANNPATWPFSFQIKEATTFNVPSKQVGAYIQDDWRVRDNLRINLGLRYDLDTNFRDNEFYEGLVTRPEFAGIEQFTSADRQMDNGNLQPRVGFSWDVKGNGNFVVRGATGFYVSRNRPWMQMTARDSTDVPQVRIDDPQRLRFFPDINAVLGGKTIAENLAAGTAARPLVMMSEDMELPKSFNKTLGFGWQMGGRSSLEVDFVDDHNFDSWGMTDRNLPATGFISPLNPRPVARFQNVNVQENFTKNWYRALETQFRTRFRGTDSLTASYTLSRNYRDGVSFHSQYRGTQRTPHEGGYNENDGRHNLSLGGAMMLPWRVQVAGIVKMISGSPRPVQVGIDIDGDGSILSDRPVGLPAQIGRDKVDESLRIINEIRTGRGLPPIPAALLDLDEFLSADMRVSKAIALRSHQLEAFFEVFNLTNKVMYEPFTMVPSIIAADFQQRRTARAPRQAQWGIRYSF
jgi:outer membrane receptor protein involved in Fe transport